MDCTYIALFYSFSPLKALLYYSHINTYIDAHDTPTYSMTCIWNNLAISILTKNTSTCGLEEPGIKPPPFQLEGNSSATWATATLSPSRKSLWAYRDYVPRDWLQWSILISLIVHIIWPSMSQVRVWDVLALLPPGTDCQSPAQRRDPPLSVCQWAQWSQVL